MTTSTVTDMNNLNGGSKQTVNGGRRKSKGSELTQKKIKIPKRGKGVAQLELEIQNMTHELPNFPSYNNNNIINNPHSAFQNVAVCFRPAPTPTMLLQGIQIHGPNLYPMDPIGSSNATGFRFDTSSSIVTNYSKCASDDCVCHKKKRITGSSHVNPFRTVNNTFMEMMDPGYSNGNGKTTRRSSGQVTEVMSVHRSGGGSRTEFEFFPGKGGGAAEEYKQLMKMGSTAATWCGGGGGVVSAVAGGLGLGLRGGEGSCVTAVTGSEEGSVSSLDLSLKLSY